MEAKVYPNKKNLYRLPWTMNDNAHGWTEITDICNIHCKGCYRRMKGDGHKSFEQIKEEILFLRKWTNCDSIILAGGEAILHPQILEIIGFIKENGMKSMIHTNGLALTEQLIKDLKNAGLTGLKFHIDSTQSRPEFRKEGAVKEKELNDLRLKYARMTKMAGMYSQFGMTVTRQNFSEIPKFVQWAIDNAKSITTISFVMFRGLPVGQGIEYYAGDRKVDVKSGTLGYIVDPEKSENLGINIKDVYASIKEHFPDYDASSYIGGSADHASFKWLLGNIIANNKGRTFGAYGKRIMEIIQTFHHFRRGSYISINKIRFGKRLFILSLFDKSLRKAFAKFMKYVIVNPVRLFYSLNTITVLMVQPADILPDGSVDMCSPCPNLCVYDGKLVNSCRLDEYRFYGNLLSARIANHTAQVNN
jgi:hypothetical protein